MAAIGVWMRSNLDSVQNLWRAYAKLVDKYPWASQIGQTAVLLSTGDVISQVVVER